MTPKVDDPPAATPNKGGRPKAAPSTSLSTWLPNQQYDRLVALALKRDQSVSALVRDLLRVTRRR